MATKFTIAAAAAFTLCGVATANAAALKAPAGTDTVCQVPYVENFNDASKVLNPQNTCDYKGWTIFGKNGNTKRFKVRTNSTLKPAGDGMYLVNNTVYGARNDWAISPAVTLVAGKQYTVACKILATGGTSSLKEHIRLTVGADTTEAAQSTVLLDLPQANYKEWTVVSAEFTPEASGNYYFGFNNCTEQRGYVVAIDDVSVTSADSNVAVAAFDVPTDGVFTDQNEMLLYPDNQLSFTNRSQNATSYLWTTGGNPGTTAEKNPVVNYPTSGTYEVSLKASNGSGDSVATATLAVRVVGDTYVGTAKARCAADSLLSTDPNFSTVSLGTEYKLGFNKHYNKFAERFQLPEQANAAVTSILLPVSKFSSSYVMGHKDYAVTIKLVADSAGLPCESQEYGRYATTEATLFGTSAVANAVCNVPFKSPISVSGPFHVVLDFDSSLSSSLTDYLALRGYRHASGATTFSVCPASGWTTVKAISGSDADDALGLAIEAQIVMNPRTATGVEGVGTDAAASVRVAGRSIVVSGLEAGEGVEAYSLQGARVYAAVAAGSQLTIDASAWPASAYIVKAGRTAAKVLVK